MILANVAADIALFQLEEGRDFISENPLRSAMWRDTRWADVLKHPRVVRAVLDQCMVGLVDPAGALTTKTT